MNYPRDINRTIYIRGWKAAPTDITPILQLMTLIFFNSNIDSLEK